MFKYILKRLLYMIPVIAGVILIVFVIMSMAQGDPVQMMLGEHATPEATEALREELGLNDPLIVRYFHYVVNLFKGDMGISYKTREPVAKEIFARWPNTIKLAAASIVVTLIIAIPLGIIAAVKQNTIIDNLSMLISMLGVSMPMFWLAMLLILLFSLHLGWLPSYGAESWKSIILPATASGFMCLAAVARTMRSSMLEVIRQDYIRTARAKGLSKSYVIRHHAVKNAMIPTITVIGMRISALLSGSVVTETVFSWPGIGRWMIQAINGRDTPTVLGCIVLFTIKISIVNLIVDLLYCAVDPRIRSQLT